MDEPHGVQVRMGIADMKVFELVRCKSATEVMYHIHSSQGAKLTKSCIGQVPKQRRDIRYG